MSDKRPIAAVVSVDPAASADCGVAMRFVTPGTTYTRGRLPRPDYLYGGPVWSTGLADDLGSVLAKGLEIEQRVLLVVAGTAYGNKVARSLGRAIGRIEGMLIDLNMLPEQSGLVYVQDSTWRRTELPALRGTRPSRDEWKKAASAAVLALYNIDVDDNQAEALLLNDHTLRYVLPKTRGFA